MAKFYILETPFTIKIVHHFSLLFTIATPPPRPFCMEVVYTVSNSVCRCILGWGGGGGGFVWRWCILCPIQFVGVYCIMYIGGGGGILYGSGVECVKVE